MQNFLNSRQKMSSEATPTGAYKPSDENMGLVKVEVVSSGKDEPKVELITESGVIRTIVVTCKCGERIELKCHY